MKHFHLFVVLAFIALTACSVQEPVPFIKGSVIEFTATYGDAETKSTLIQDGLLPNGQPQMITWWSPEEDICIYYGASEGNKFTSTNTELAKKVTFRGILDAFTGENESGDYNYFWAIYPYDAAVSCDGQSVVAILADEQEALAGSYANNTNITIAKSSGLSLGFYNVCSFLRFTVEKEGVIAATFRGNNNEDVAGKFRVSIGTDGKPTAPEVIEGEKEINLRRPNDEPFVVGTSYYFVILPQTFENGFTVQFDTTDETGSRVITVSAPFTRNNINYGNTAFDHNVTYVRTRPANNEVWYTSVGDVVVNPFSECDWVRMDMIESNTMIDGIGKIVFKNDISDVPYQAFYQHLYSGPLKTIQLPNSVTRINGKAFYGCSSLETILVPEHLVAIEDYAFYKCSKLEGIVLPSSLSSLGVNVFTDCYSLRTLTLNTSASFHSNGLAYLLKGSSIETILGPYATSDGKYAIIDNALTMAAGYNITSAVIPSGVSSINPYVFYDNSSVKTVTIPESVNTIGTYSFYGCKSLDYIAIEHITPPSIVDSFDETNECPILVPSQSVSEYKTAWPEYSIRIGATLDDIPISLSKNGTANSYIVNSAGSYRFSANRLGNSNSAINSITTGTPSTVEILWESTLIPPLYSYDSFSYGHETGTLISNIQYVNEQIVFTTTGNEGNALVALKNSSGTIMWSWHLWFVNEEINELATSSSLKIMDRNLGAMKSNDERTEPTSGLLYQRGRKDPFVGGDSELWNYQMNTADYTTSIRNPTTLYGTDSEGWNTSSQGWHPKDMYDPCPPGWKIPQMSDFSGNWTFTYETHHYPISRVKDFISVEGYYYDDIEFPLAGKISIWGNNECFVYRGLFSEGYYYLSDGYYSFRAGDGETFDNSFYSQVLSETANSAAAYSIRCCRDE